MVNALSIDVEEYFHAANLQHVAPRDKWDSLPSRVEPSTKKVLEIFAKNNTKGTFFVLGLVAEKHPLLVKKIVAEGHELASHGTEHKLVYHQSKEEFFDDILSSKKLLEDISGVKVKGYRAPNFSITDKTPWAYEQLLKAGYEYDSSLHPVWHPRYGNVGKNFRPHKVTINGQSLDILPLATTSLTNFFPSLRFSVAGGAYWRLLPFPLMQMGLRRSAKTDSLSLNCYFHPWEIDIEQPVFPELSFLTSLRHYGGTEKFPKRLNSLLKEFRFGTIQQLREQSHFAGADENE